MRYVNRQKGSGTRILLDYLLKQAGLSGAEIRGYEREEITHTAVAAAVASGTADAGMGILAAAKIYDLALIPICEEEYDFLISEESWNHPQFHRFMQVLKGAELASRLEAMGGYKLDRPGETIAL